MMPCSKGFPVMLSNCQKPIKQDIWHIKSIPEKTEIKKELQDPMYISTDHDRILTNTEALELCNNLENDFSNLVLLSDFVKKNRNSIIQLPKSEVANDVFIRICGLDGTCYSGEDYMLESWEELYLPKPTRMEVLGIIDSSKGMIPFPQWIVLVGEDGHVYGYEDEVLLLFATSLKEMLQDGIKDTGIYYEYPDHLSNEEEEVLQKDEEIQKIRLKTKEFIDQDADDFNDFLESL